MYLNLFARLLVLLALLIGTALTDRGCYTTGNTWSEIGDDGDFDVAFKIICGKMKGRYQLYETIEECLDVKNNRVDASIHILESENSTVTPLVDLHLEVCETLLNKAKSDCNKKGGLVNEFAHLGPESHKYGFIKGDDRVDPNRGKC